MAAAQPETIEIETEPERAVITMAEPAPAQPQGSFEVFFDGSSEGAYGQFFGPALVGGKTSFSQIISPGPNKGELVLQLRCGKTDATDGNTYTVSNVKIEEVAFNYVQTPETKVVTRLDKQPNYIEQLEKTPATAPRSALKRLPLRGRNPGSPSSSWIPV